MSNSHERVKPEYSQLRSLENALERKAQYSEEAEIPALAAAAAARKRAVTFQQPAERQKISTVSPQFLEKPKPLRTFVPTELRKAAAQSEVEFVEEARRREDVERAERAAIADALIESRVAVPDGDYAPPPSLDFVDEDEEDRRTLRDACAASAAQAELDRQRDEAEFQASLAQVLHLSQIEAQEEFDRILSEVEQAEQLLATQHHSASSSSRF